MSKNSLEIELTQGQVARVSREDADLIDLGWYASCVKGRYYAVRNIPAPTRSGKTLEHLHRVILARIVGRPLRRGEETNFVDRDSLNCQRDNLRLATHGQNQQYARTNANSRTGQNGVYYSTRERKYKAHIRVNGKRLHLGSFDTQGEAVKARRAAELEYHGAFAGSVNHDDK